MLLDKLTEDREKIERLLALTNSCLSMFYRRGNYIRYESKIIVLVGFMPEEPEITVVSEKGQIVIPYSVRSKLGLKPKTKLLVYGTEDTVILKKLELPDLEEEWKRLKRMVDKKIAKYGELTEKEIEEGVHAYRRQKGMLQ